MYIIIDHMTFHIIDRGLVHHWIQTILTSYWKMIHQNFSPAIIQVSSICQSFPYQNFEITNSPKFFPATILHYIIINQTIADLYMHT